MINGIYIYIWVNYHMGVSENGEKTPKPNGFHDQTNPITNGYFIGNIPYFQTNPYFTDLKCWGHLGMISLMKTHGFQSSGERRVRS